MFKPQRLFAKPSRKPTASRTFRVERLEARELMAANFLGDGAQLYLPTSGATATLATAGIDAGSMTTAGNTADIGPTGFDIPTLHSNLGAPATIYLDFNGHQESGVAGAPHNGYLTTPPFDVTFTDPVANAGNTPYRFVAGEQDYIRGIWALVAEDFAPFNINVTTVDPSGTVNPDRILRVVIGGKDFTGEGKGGRAHINAFSDPSLANVVHVFTLKGDGDLWSARIIAESVSHEVGHAFGIGHTKQAGDNLKAPIMGDHGAAAATRGTWWDGQMDVIASVKNGFGYRADDHASSLAAATPMLHSAFTVIAPEATPTAALFAKGIIGSTSDVDVFRFATGGGEVKIRVTLPQAKFPINAAGLLTTTSVGNLHTVVRLMDAHGNQIAIDNDQFDGEGWLTAMLPAGSYYVEVGSFGKQGDVGQYTLFVSESVGARVVACEYQSLSASQAVVWITFNEAINPHTFTTADVTINGAAAGVGVISVEAVAGDPKRFMVKLIKPVTGTTAQLTLAIGPQISDAFGNAMDQNNNGKTGEAADYYFATLGLPTTATTKTGANKGTTSPRSR
jgi:hypothetical protein